MSTISKRLFVSTQQGVYVNYSNELPEPTLWMAVSMEGNKPKVYEGEGDNPDKILLSNGEYYTYLTKEQSDALEFVEKNNMLYVKLNPIVVPDEGVLKKAKKVEGSIWG